MVCKHQDSRRSDVAIGQFFEIDLIGQACQDFAMSGDEFENDSEGWIVALEFGLKEHRIHLCASLLL